MVRVASVIAAVLAFPSTGFAKPRCPEGTRAKTVKLEDEGGQRQFCVHKETDKRHGPWVEVVPGIRHEVNFVNGVKQGAYLRKDRDFTTRGSYDSGLRDGEWKTTVNDGGRLVRVNRYRKGRMTGLQESWDRSGKKCRSSNIAQGRGTLQEHVLGTCQLSAVVLVEHGVFHGPAKHLDPTMSKKLSAKGSYFGGDKHGIWQHWDILNRSSVSHRCYVAGVQLWSAKKLDPSRKCEGAAGPLPRDTVSVGLVLARAGATKPLLVSGLVQGGPAARAGMQVGDAIERIGDQDASMMDAATATEALKKAGSPVKLRVRRGSERKTVELRPALLSGMLVRNAWLDAHRQRVNK